MTPTAKSLKPSSVNTQPSSNMHPIARLLKNPKTMLSSVVEMDESVTSACMSFDYAFRGASSFTLPEFDAPMRDGSWGLGVIVGPSGSGKSSLISRHYGHTPPVEWNPKKAIVSQVSPEKLAAVGLSSVPVWCKPFHVLSTGEAFRANMAAGIGNNTSFDEFTSTVDRTVAKSCSYALSRFIRQQGVTGVVLCSCHYDIVEWLNPDWIFDTSTGRLALKGCLRRREPVEIRVHPCGPQSWGMFRDHHYLTGDMNKSAHCFLAMWNDTPVGFASALAFPNGNFNNGWRGHRTVVIPDFQGLGIGVRLSDFVARHYVSQGKRYFSKTSHPRMGEYRERSPLWVATSKNRKARPDYKAGRSTKEDNYKMRHTSRVCYSHEYVGGAA